MMLWGLRIAAQAYMTLWHSFYQRNIALCWQGVVWIIQGNGDREIAFIGFNTNVQCFKQHKWNTLIPDTLKSRQIKPEGHLIQILIWVSQFFKMVLNLLNTSGFIFYLMCGILNHLTDIVIHNECNDRINNNTITTRIIRQESVTWEEIQTRK